MKKALMDDVSLKLLSRGYVVKTVLGCFDIIARNGSRILLLKVLEDADSVNIESVESMKRIAGYVAGTPLIIAEKSGERLVDNVVHSRFGIFTINTRTFANCLDNKLPFVKSQKAGLVAEVIGVQLKKLRENEGLSLKMISRKLGVSPRMISKYEVGEAEITINKAMKIYDVFGGRIFKPINVFDFHGNYKGIGNSKLSEKYKELGFESSETKKAPFDIISRKDNELILTKIGDKIDVNLNPISKMVNADELIIFKKKKPKGIPALTEDEFLDFDKAKELIKFLKETR
ncbi:MAG TPA: helix-turn-helix domain-containing protein [Candidatus Nanoarchaeia archaeon]|nr:helix-turn-helix domain-containing protein [Candidatus Nanoarchaeia archaeon]